jgi:hypothetical protein
MAEILTGFSVDDHLPMRLVRKVDKRDRIVRRHGRLSKRKTA